MSNLAIYQQPFSDVAIQKLEKSEARIVKASIPSEVNLRISQMSPEDMGSLITEIAAKVAVRLGTEKTDEEQVLINRELNSDLVKFPTLTRNEIMRALVNGLDGQYLREGGFVYFTPSNFVQWIKAYIEQDKKPAMKKVAQFDQQTPTLLPEHQKSPQEQIWDSYYFLEWVLTEKTLKGMDFIDVGQRVYTFLEDFEYLNLSPKEKWDYVEKAKAKMLGEAVASGNSSGLRSIKKIFEDSPAGVVNETIACAAKRLIVSEKLYEIAKDGVDDVADFLENAKERVQDFVNQLDRETE